jgi:hypothetical protein
MELLLEKRTTTPAREAGVNFRLFQECCGGARERKEALVPREGIVVDSLATA